MPKGEKIPEKLFQYLLHLYDDRDSRYIHEFFSHSEIYMETIESFRYDNVHNLHVLLNPEVYKKNQKLLENYKSILSNKFEELTQISIDSIRFLPDMSKFQVLENRIVPVITPWEDINIGQNHLVNLLRTAKETVDFQNVGNASRTLLQKLANIIFDKDIHIPSDQNINLGEAYYKNRLHTYIRTELSGDKNKELRNFALSVISTAEDSVDLSNKLTHDLNASNMSSEFCVISTITVISIVKLIKQKK